MTSAYIIFIKEKTTDQRELDSYKSEVGKSFENRDIAIRVAYGKQEVLEGPTSEGVVVLEFSDWDAAKNWYESSSYQSALQHRLAGAEYRAILVEGRT